MNLLLNADKSMYYKYFIWFNQQCLLFGRCMGAYFPKNFFLPTKAQIRNTGALYFPQSIVTELYKNMKRVPLSLGTLTVTIIVAFLCQKLWNQICLMFPTLL